MQILLVEDNREYARFVEALLASSTSLACGLTHAAALAPALAALDAGGIDLVLLDLVLPDSEGIDTFARVHARARQIPIIVLTGYADDRTAARAMQEGAQDYLIKSHVDAHQLTRAIRYAIDRKHAVETARRSEQHFRLLIENALDITTILDHDGVVRFQSPSVERVLGYAPAELLGSCMLDLVHPDSLTRVRHALRAARRGRSGVQALELRVRDRLGEWRSLEAIARLLPLDASIPGVVVNARDVTERRRAQEALLAGEQRFRELFENANDAIFTYDLTGHFTSLNHAGERLLGYSRYEMPTIHLSWVIAPNDLPRVHEMIAAKVEGRVSNTVYEIDLIAKDGTSVPVEVSSRLILQDGQPVGIQGTARDITERRRAEEAIRRTEERYRELFENANDIVYTTDLDGRFTSFNQAGERISGYTRAEAIGMHATEVIVPEHRERVAQILSQRVADNIPLTYEIEIATKDGRRVPVEVSSRVMYRDGQPIGTQGIARDITERKRVSETRREAERRYRQFFDEDLTGDFLARANGELLACNMAFATIFGFSSVEEVQRHSYLALFPTPEGAAQLLEQIQAAGRVENHEQVYRRKDGKPAYVIQNVIGTFGPDGELVELRGYAFDITAHKQVEEQLRQAQKMEAVGRLAGGVAHDFNNLLTVITGYGDRIMERLDEDDPLRKGIDAIKKAADRAAALTEQLLAFSRQQVLAPKVLDFNLVVTNMETLLRRLIGEHIELATVCGSGIGRVRADPGRLEQVIMNLAVNARDAMPQGGTLTIETSNADLDRAYAERFVWLRPGRFVMLTVRDTGCGMDPETQARLFEPFFTTKAQGKGTGLGLSTAYGIIKQSGGFIWVESEPAQGATFRIILPRVEEAIEPIAAERATRRAPRGTETILLVEDEDDVRQLLKEVLDGFGYTVLEARNGAEALAVDERQPTAALLLTDVVMPQMSGRELAQRMLQRHGQLKILYMSGYTDDAIIQHGGLEPGTAFLQKPFPPSVLARRIREVLDQASTVDSR